MTSFASTRLGADYDGGFSLGRTGDGLIVSENDGDYVPTLGFETVEVPAGGIDMYGLRTGEYSAPSSGSRRDGISITKFKTKTSEVDIDIPDTHGSTMRDIDDRIEEARTGVSLSHRNKKKSLINKLEQPVENTADRLQDFVKKIPRVWYIIAAMVILAMTIMWAYNHTIVQFTFGNRRGDKKGCKKSRGATLIQFGGGGHLEGPITTKFIVGSGAPTVLAKHHKGDHYCAFTPDEIAALVAYKAEISATKVSTTDGSGTEISTSSPVVITRAPSATVVDATPAPATMVESTLPPASDASTLLARLGVSKNVTFATTA